MAQPDKKDVLPGTFKFNVRYLTIHNNGKESSSV
jgi:hypothetical protein